MNDARLLWTDRVLVLSHDGRAVPLSGYSRAPLSRTAASTIVPWADLRRLEAAHPWPTLRAVWQTEVGQREIHFHPRGQRWFLPRKPTAVEELARFSVVVEELFTWLSTELGDLPDSVFDRGWLAEQDAPWESVDALPEGAPDEDGGAYRSDTWSRRVVSSRVVARRPRPSVFETLALWLAQSDRKPWRETLREVVLTEHHVWVQLWDRSCWRLPVAMLVARLGVPGSDSVYVFGRRTFLVLTERRGCRVSSALDRHLPYPGRAAMGGGT